MKILVKYNEVIGFLWKSDVQSGFYFRISQKFHGLPLERCTATVFEKKYLPCTICSVDVFKKNISLVIGISIPILMILLVAGSIYLPGVFIQPQYDFVYASGNDHYRGLVWYSVRDGVLTKDERAFTEEEKDALRHSDSHIYVYNVTRDESREISFEEAQRLRLDARTESPDGFEVVHGTHSEGIFPFFISSATDYRTVYLTGHNVSRKVDVPSYGSSYGSDFLFLGWIQKDAYDN